MLNISSHHSEGIELAINPGLSGGIDWTEFMICHGPPLQLIDDHHLLEGFPCQSVEGHMLAYWLAGLYSTDTN